MEEGALVLTLPVVGAGQGRAAIPSLATTALAESVRLWPEQGLPPYRFRLVLRLMFQTGRPLPDRAELAAGAVIPS